eukprot:Lankesteria_metandrocarpae@DN10579_c0_g1_i1.p1
MTLCPLDGRYLSDVAPLGMFTDSEISRQRVYVECMWLIHLSQRPETDWLFTEGTLLQDDQKELMELVALDWNSAEGSVYYTEVKEIESNTRHDVKAVEYFVKRHLTKSSSPRLRGAATFVHFCCTSEDINSTAYSLSVQTAWREVMRPKILEILQLLCTRALETASQPFMSMTHGQPASPTTFGKEMAVFAERLKNNLAAADQSKFSAKFSGAVGSFNAHYAVDPSADWPCITKSFVEDSLGLTHTAVSTQIDPRDNLAYFLDALKRINTALKGLCVDMWLYISRGVLTLKKVEGEVGSSTMPHKVNPIDFENAEGNLGIANCLLTFLSEKLTQSRMQRDLSDSTCMRNLGMTLGYCYLAYSSLLKGFGRVVPNSTAMADELKHQWQLIGEGVQCVLKVAGVADAYEIVQQSSGESIKGIALSRCDAAAKSQSHDNLLKTVQFITDVTPLNYVGASEDIARRTVKSIQNDFLPVYSE